MSIFAEAYGLPDDFAILIEANWHRVTPTEQDLEPVTYYSHDLPDGIPEFVVTSFARRSLKEFKNLEEIYNHICSLSISPKRQIRDSINEIIETSGFKPYINPKEYKRFMEGEGKRGLLILRHAAIYQKKIVEHEHHGIFPRKLPEIIEQANLVNQKAGK